ncbi:ubiquinone binding protein Coq10 [Schizosaccharomyces cryophilus OY26]|uniref:Ubiquinone binding protein Coq10 n=1 Tax=Schizosaccharomyces cryophilus (strain OY26 / ATCC MYA-4695 / CBS 11777 / NBRC 106824 / NRRL Y48691) TaxID=653667 RepID=S9VUE9_SCHCR|nr:ubiquinone binding protein Coq10 [Schizosaccharomyces cryophilus OY26]EPY49794.1 ubiquinone binding protein Coq10 [Schizosaccharomyces cryophilus OY26]
MAFRGTLQCFECFRASKLMPYKPSFLFRLISDIDEYERFVPFCQKSKVTSRDLTTGLPNKADLTIGFGNFCETFDSRVVCDPVARTVLADASHHQLFQHLKTNWEIVEASKGRVRVDLEVDFEFTNKLHSVVSKLTGSTVATEIIKGFVNQAKQKYELEQSKKPLVDDASSDL